MKNNLRNTTTGKVLTLLAVVATTARFSMAQAPEGTASPVEPDRASISQPSAPAAAEPADQEAALRQAEDDLLKKLSGSLPPSTGASSEGVSTIVVSEPPKPAAVAQPAGAVLSERVGVPTQPAPVGVAQNQQIKPEESSVPPLAVCPPCSVKPAATNRASKGSGSGVARKPSVAVASAKTTRDEFSFHGRSGNCSESIDDPYVPTSKQARVVASRAHLRLAPGRSESSLFVMPKNAIVSIEFRDGQWYRVVTATGIRGWLATSDVIFDVDVPESSTVKVGPYNASYEPTGITF